MLAEDGTAYRLVPEERVAWHAGRSHWRGREALNATSIGIEIVNLHGDRHDYPPQQIAALIELCRDILARHPAIEPRNVVGHSDIAPQRKIDPGRRFPWKTLADAGIGLWPKAGGRPLFGDFHAALQRYGYAPPVAVPPREIVKAFQRHFRPAKVDGMADPETRALLAGCLTRWEERPSSGPRVRRLDGCTLPGNREGEESPGSTETRCRLTAGGGDPRESATENRPPGWPAFGGSRR